MADPQIRFDSERLDARLERVTQSLADSAQDAEHLQRLATVGTVAGLIAHEFRNLMTPVRSYAQLALRRPGDTELTRKALESAMYGAEQAAAIAESLLELTGAAGGDGMGRIAGGADRCLVDHAVNNVRIVLEDLLDESGVVVESELEPGLWVSISEVDLKQVLMNLVQNAVKSVRANGGGVVQVFARLEEGEGWSLASDLEDGGVGDASVDGAVCSWHIEGEWGGGDRRVVIEVSDCGGGIACDAVGGVFEAFVSGGGGRGMGLATCRVLMGKAGGRIGVVSCRGEGTRFVLELPS